MHKVEISTSGIITTVKLDGKELDNLRTVDVHYAHDRVVTMDMVMMARNDFTIVEEPGAINISVMVMPGYKLVESVDLSTNTRTWTAKKI